MPDKTDILTTPEGVSPAEDVLGGAGPRGEVAGCPTGLADDEAVEVRKGVSTPGTEGETAQESGQ
jgi:hypothetical protein